MTTEYEMNIPLKVYSKKNEMNRVGLWEKKSVRIDPVYRKAINPDFFLRCVVLTHYFFPNLNPIG